METFFVVKVSIIIFLPFVTIISYFVTLKRLGNFDS